MKTKLYPLITAFVLALASMNASLAQPSGWSNYSPVMVSENSGATITNYQLRMEINTADLILLGKLESDGRDLRFGKDVAGTTLYPYWIESGMNTATTVVWVRIDTLFASATRAFYMFNGNPAATAVSTPLGVFFGPNSATDSVASGGGGGVGYSQRGFRFSPTEELLVTHFGKREPTGSTRYVTLFDFVTQQILTQFQVSGPAGQYNYGALPQPLWLTAGTQYLLELYQGNSDGYYFGTSSQIGQHLIYYDMRYCNSCTQNTFPTSYLNNYHYGYPDLWYFTRKHVSPAPTYESCETAGGNGIISGVARYDNNPMTPLDGLKITLKKDGAPVGSPVVTSATGTYQFTGLSLGNYDLQIESAAPGGVWQTWNGVNNTDYLLVSRHASGIALLPSDPPVVRVAADVKSPQPVPDITAADANAIRLAARYGWGSPVPYFEIPKWVFSGSDNTKPLTGISVQCFNMVRDIRGLCAGDVNGSYVPPSGMKSVTPTVELSNLGELSAGSDLLIPVYSAGNLETSAITLFLSFDDSRIKITGVTMATPVQEEPYVVTAPGAVHIGWASLEPVRLDAGAPLLYLHATLKGKLSAPVSFTMLSWPPSEIAGPEGEVINPVHLTMPTLSSNTKGEQNVLVYPNPASGRINIDLRVSQPGTLSFTLNDLQGITRLNVQHELPEGPHHESIDISGIAAGVYLLKTNMDGEIHISRVVIVR